MISGLQERQVSFFVASFGIETTDFVSGSNSMYLMRQEPAVAPARHGNCPLQDGCCNILPCTRGVTT